MVHSTCNEDWETLRVRVAKAVKYGVFLYHETLKIESAYNMAKGLYQKNFPNQEIPKDFLEQLDHLIDKRTGKTFNTIISDAVCDDWAHSKVTFETLQRLMKMMDELDDRDFVKQIDIEADWLNQIYFGADKMHQYILDNTKEKERL